MARGADLPTGTLTFLFTDIEGSTRLLNELGESYDAALTEHRRLLRASFEAFNGRELNTEGDAFFVAFERASDAVAAAVKFQLDLTTYEWPHEPIKVRAGLHTGDARIVDDDLVGLAIHQAARISSAAHGGQVLVSATTATLADDAAEFADVGRYQLKDIAGETQLFEVSHPELPTFGRARMAVVRPNNLPRPATNFVARDSEVADVLSLTASADVVTIAGTAGAGKTRLALAVGEALLDECADGVWYLDLTSEPAESVVWDGLAEAIGVDSSGDRTTKAAVLETLSTARAAVILDGCEHVLGVAAAVLSELRVAGPSLSLIATTREPLGVAGESVWRVPELDDAGAVQLFVERARQANASFDDSDDDLEVISNICRMLDRLPLALELAAVRTRMMSVTEIDERLADRFKLLTGGDTTNARQKTLRAAVDWSYDHLGDDERILLRRLSAFIGTFALDAVERICDFDHALRQHAIDVTDSLVQRSLLNVEYAEGRARYRLLESIRLYARDELARSGEADAVLLQHLRWYADWAGQIESRLSSGVDASMLTEAVNRDLENVRRALRRADRLDHEAGLRLAVGLSPFWERRSFAEGYDAIERYLDAAAPWGELRARALLALGRLARVKGATEDEIARLTEAAEITTISPRWRGEIAHSLGVALQSSDLARAMEQLTLAVDLFAQGVRPGRQALALHDLAVCEFNTGDGETAYAHLLDASDLANRSGDDLVATMVLGTLALVDNYSGNADIAQERLSRMMDLAERLNSAEALIRAHTIAAQVDAYNGKLLDAVQHNFKLTELFDVGSVSVEARNQVRLELASMLTAVGEYDKARKLLEKELASLSSELVTALVSTLGAVGLLEMYTGRFDLSQRAYAQAVGAATNAGLPALADAVAIDQVAAMLASGDLDAARALHDEVSNRNGEVRSLVSAALLIAEGQADEARVVVEACSEQAATPLAMAAPLEMAGHVLARTRPSDVGAEIIGATLAAYESLELAEGAPARLRRERSTELLVDRIGQAAFDAAVKRGAAMPVEEAFAYACDELRTTGN